MKTPAAIARSARTTPKPPKLRKNDSPVKINQMARSNIPMFRVILMTVLREMGKVVKVARSVPPR
jgi:hypothetical protein